MEVSISEPVPDDEEEDRRSSVRKQTDTRRYGKKVLITQGCFDCLQCRLFYNWALKLKQMVEDGPVPYGNIFREMKKENVRQKL